MATATTSDSLTILPPALIPSIPRIYDQDGMGDDAIVHLHVFGPAGDWWITEVDEDGISAFGYVRLASMPDCAELGYIHIPELQSIADTFKANPSRNLRYLLERDLHWTPTRLGRVKACLG
jgi:hypothetical protein